MFHKEMIKKYVSEHLETIKFQDEKNEVEIVDIDNIKNSEEKKNEDENTCGICL